jgi:hypothetical protein
LQSGGGMSVVKNDDWRRSRVGDVLPDASGVAERNRSTTPGERRERKGSGSRRHGERRIVKIDEMS